MSNPNDLDTGPVQPRPAPPDVTAIRNRPVAEPPVTVMVGARSDAGRVRPNNEDHFIVARLGRSLQVIATNLAEGRVPARFEEVGHAFAVADGMGGEAGGEVASDLALTIGASLTLSERRWHLRLGEGEEQHLVERVRQYFKTIDQALYKHSQRTPGLQGMGTTLTVVYTVGLEAFVFHVGDSRAYLWRDDRLRQLTRDQTMAQVLADAGSLTPEEAARHRLRHVLTQAMGTRDETKADVSTLRLASGDRLLLCTDGLTDMVPDADVTALCGMALDAETTCARLVDAALANGGRDNVTVIVADFAA
jgi:protein phosphatase